MMVTASASSEVNARVMDAGAGYGFSTAWLALGLAAKCVDNCVVEAVERDREVFTELKRNIKGFVKEAGLEVELVFINRDAVEHLKEVDAEYRLIFVDIDKDMYVDVLKVIYDKLERNGVAVFHNAIEPPPSPVFINEVFSTRWRSILIPTRRGLLVSYKDQQ